MMEITTKFNPCDKVWVMKNNKPYQFSVSRIEIEITAPNTLKEKYIEHIPGLSLMDKDKEYEYQFYECFSTKIELLNSFLEND